MEILIAGGMLAVAVIAAAVYYMKQKPGCQLTLFAERNPNPVLCMTLGGDITYANRSTASMLRRLGFAVDDYEKLLPNSFREQLRELTTFRQGTTAWEYTIGEKSLETRAYYFSDIHTFHLYITDITKKKAAEDELVHQAYHDRLTSLPNQRMLNEYLHKRLIRRHDRPFALVALKLGHLEHFEEGLGTSASDNLILQVSERLSQALSLCQQGCRNTHLYRTESNKFIMLLDEIASKHVPIQLIDDIHSAFNKPFAISSHQHTITYNIGVTFYPDDAQQAEGLLQNVNSALNRSCISGDNNFMCYSPEMNALAMERLMLENDLRNALANHEFSVHYQPKVHMVSRQLVGAEALMRWEHPIGGEIPPDKFIALAEEIDFIIPISEWLLDNVCRQIAEWQQKGLGVMPVAINISASHFTDYTLPATVQGAIANAGINPSMLELEITERVTVNNVEETIETLMTLKNIGVSLAIDDFGTGYASLAYLQRFPLDTLKIDQSFVKGLGTDSGSTTIVNAIIGLAHNLGLKLIAEGVETQEQCDLLRTFGCELGQGYLFSRPLPAEDFAKILELEALDKKGS